mmetsp:Transcript_14517/g.21402  ORF Transcript_14517/g.21402 Transcript_14517/m.21402 type:complete len:120 (-) Transcript_14517:149-508(-)
MYRYSATLVLSTLGNAVLLKHGVQKNIAFWGTLYSCAIINYFLLKWFSMQESANQDIMKDGKKVRGGSMESFRGGAIENGLTGALARIWSETCGGKRHKNELVSFVRSTGPQCIHARSL